MRIGMLTIIIDILSFWKRESDIIDTGSAVQSRRTSNVPTQGTGEWIWMLAVIIDVCQRVDRVLFFTSLASRECNEKNRVVRVRRQCNTKLRPGNKKLGPLCDSSDS